MKKGNAYEIKILFLFEEEDGKYRKAIRDGKFGEK